MKFLGIFFLFAYLFTQKTSLLTYHTLKVADKQLTISLRPTQESYHIYLQAVSHDVLVKETGILIPKDSLGTFLTEVQTAYGKYKEWTKVAQKNQVNKYSRDLPIVTRKDGYFISGGKFHYSHDLPLRFTFQTSQGKKGVKTHMLLHSTKFLSRENEYIHCKGFSISLSSSEDFEGLIGALQPKKIDSFLQNKSYDTLFQN